MKTKHYVMIGSILIFIIILLQNTQVINFRILFWKISMSQVILLFLMFLLGIITGYIPGYLRAKNKYSDREKTK